MATDPPGTPVAPCIKIRIRQGEDKEEKEREVLHLFRCYTHTLYYCLIYNFVPLVKPISIHQRKLNSKTIELRMNVQGLPCHHVHLSSCQPPIIQELERVTARERMNSRVEHSWVRNIVFFRLNMFPWSVAFFGDASCRQKVHRTVAKARFLLLEDEVGKVCTGLRQSPVCT